MGVARGAAAVSVGGLAERVRSHTDTTVESVAGVAGSADTLIIVLVAVVVNGDAVVIGVEEPSFGAFQANLVFPVPDAAAEISGSSVI